ncbi:metal-dependent hydrolase [Candidatus Pantoea edessiphila]|uniref:Metal-dependent hydrolase n=1 Tax=Candidatus Pantoea edessiphila TaxID=2044610 RepID=A0A2P5SYT4_9GAMM|nr:metal-dependent hydrolase [Candidatus Pantoea edessiphila]MBK4775375.1 metal-dependent hydrolase [Pantoea sp. Edef]PPI87494.1 metal-dependent hydrolase [Candidatus Pantoea edessiphila]
MTANGHIFFALACAICAKHFELTKVIIQADWWHLIPAVLITCLIPDIDHPYSLIGQRLRWISLPISLIFGHRGFTHSFLALIFLSSFKIICLDNISIPDDIFQGMIIGYCSHIIADALTPAGVPLFWPYRKRFGIPVINNKKNKNIEQKICCCLIGFTILFPIFEPLLVKFIIPLAIKLF